MLKTWRAVLLFPLLCFLASHPLQAQRTSGGGHTGGVIDVQVRNPNGTPGPRGIHIRLESAEGGAEADAETIDGGKCEFRLSLSGVYLVRLTEPHYKEMAERVELTSVSRGYVTLELKPLPGEHPDEPVVDSPPSGIVSVKNLNVPENAQQEYAKGEAALRAKDSRQAAKHFEKAAKLYDNYPQAYRMLGEAYLEQHDWQKSEEAFKKSIALDPTLVDAYVDLGAVYNQQKNYTQAEILLKKGLELSPEATGAKYELAKTYWALNRWQDAAPLAKAAVTDLPDLGPAHVLYGNILLRQRDGAGALREYKEYLRLEPGGAMATAVREQVEKLQKALAK
jgi:tetratricopeptide (TPR) repeat protein